MKESMVELVIAKYIIYYPLCEFIRQTHIFRSCDDTIFHQFRVECGGGGSSKRQIVSSPIVRIIRESVWV